MTRWVTASDVQRGQIPRSSEQLLYTPPGGIRSAADIADPSSLADLTVPDQLLDPTHRAQVSGLGRRHCSASPALVDGARFGLVDRTQEGMRRERLELWPPQHVALDSDEAGRPVDLPHVPDVRTVEILGHLGTDCRRPCFQLRICAGPTCLDPDHRQSPRPRPALHEARTTRNLVPRRQARGVDAGVDEHLTNWSC